MLCLSRVFRCEVYGPFIGVLLLSVVRLPRLSSGSECPVSAIVGRSVVYDSFLSVGDVVGKISLANVPGHRTIYLVRVLLCLAPPVSGIR